MVDWSSVLSTENKVIWGKLLIAPQQAGVIRGYRINQNNRDIEILFPEDLPANRWLQIYQSRLPVLADQLLQWPNQGIALAYSYDPEELCHTQESVSPVIAPYPVKQWNQSSEVLYRQTYSKKSQTTATEDLLNMTYSVSLEGRDILNLYPNEIWAWYHQDKLYVQVFGPWPYLFAENASRVLGIPDENIFFQVPENQAPSTLMSPFLIVGSLYAGILALHTRAPVRFLVDRDFLQAWPCRAPSLQVDISLEHNPRGEIKTFNMHARMDNGFKGPFVSELTARFLYTFVQMLPDSDFWLEAWCLETHSVPRLPPFAWAESAATLIVNRIRLAIAKKIAPADYDPSLTLPNTFAALAERINSEIYWRRWWANDKIATKSTLRNNYGSGMAAGYHNSGFVETALTSCSIRVALLPRDKTLKIDIPLPLSAEILDTVKQSAPALGEVRLQTEQWFDFSASNPGPCLVGRSFEILPKLIQHAYKSVLKKKRTSRGRIFQNAIFRRPKSKLWDSVKLQGQPYLSSFPYLIFVRVEWDTAFQKFSLLQLCVATEGVLFESPSEVLKILHRNLWHILTWLSLDLDLENVVIRLLPENLHKKEKKSVQSLLWTALPAALIQACTMANPKWQAGLIQEDGHEL